AEGGPCGRPCLPCSAGSGMGWLTLPAGYSPWARQPPRLAHHPAVCSWTAASPATGMTTA
ncbi:PKMYT1 isoform 16, partial [Pan troglodytes]